MVGFFGQTGFRNSFNSFAAAGFAAGFFVTFAAGFFVAASAEMEPIPPINNAVAIPAAIALRLMPTRLRVNCILVLSGDQKMARGWPAVWTTGEKYY